MTKSTHPADRMEAIYAKMNESERAIARYEALGFTSSLEAERRTLAGLKSARTRILRSL